MTGVLVPPQVWDFAGDGYVHRLLYHKGEGQGKVVEVCVWHTPASLILERPIVWHVPLC